MASEEILRLEGIDKLFGETQVLHSLTLSVRRHEFLTLLGPSGCGKTTTLRIIAGLTPADRGRVLIEGEDVSSAPPEKRPVNTVFQNYALFPHMNVEKNIAYGLKMRGVPRTEAARRVRELLDVNLVGPFFLTQLVAKKMIEQGSGTIVNITSMSSDVVSTNRGEYCVSKAGISMMTQLYAARLAEYGIPVYEIRPGIIRTDMTSKVTEKYDALLSGGLAPIARWGEPEDVAEAVAVLAQGRLRYSTGEVINVDGGIHIQRL